MKRAHRKTLLLFINGDRLFLKHRLPIALAVMNRGWRVVVVTKDLGKSEEIKSYGFEFVNLNFSRSGTNPILEIGLLVRLFYLYKSINPDIVYHVTMKPVIYGSLVARVLKLKTVNAVCGLGYNFTAERKSLVRQIMIKLMRWGFRKKSNYLVFENQEDPVDLENLGIPGPDNVITVVKGVGVDLGKYAYHPPLKEKGKLEVLFPSRMLWDKGVREFVEAAKLLQEKYQGKVLFKLYGMLDPGNVSEVPEKYLLDETIEEYLEWYGHQENMVEAYRNSDLVVLPSYREGLPTVLSEAASSGRPIITTNAPGCSQCVEDGWNGYTVPVRSVINLANNIEKVLDDEENRILMGMNSRLKAEREFDYRKVVDTHIKIFDSLLNSS
jgi:glycosyltransferase involved in cell wall biosynthesis